MTGKWRAAKCKLAWAIRSICKECVSDISDEWITLAARCDSSPRLQRPLHRILEFKCGKSCRTTEFHSVFDTFWNFFRVCFKVCSCRVHRSGASAVSGFESFDRFVTFCRPYLNTANRLYPRPFLTPLFLPVCRCTWSQRTACSPALGVTNAMQVLLW